MTAEAMVVCVDGRTKSREDSGLGTAYEKCNGCRQSKG
jgi:hypothetical protein